MSPPKYDAIVVGLGGMGSAALYHLASRGLKVKISKLTKNILQVEQLRAASMYPLKIPVIGPLSPFLHLLSVIRQSKWT